MRSIAQMKNDLLSPQDVCDILKIKLRTLYNWKNQNKIPAVKMGRSLRFRRIDIEEFLKKLKTKNVNT